MLDDVIKTAHEIGLMFGREDPQCEEIICAECPAYKEINGKKKCIFIFMYEVKNTMDKTEKIKNLMTKIHQDYQGGQVRQNISHKKCSDIRCTECPLYVRYKGGPICAYKLFKVED